MNDTFQLIKPTIQSPTLLLDTHRCRENIRRMASKSEHLDLTLRPHFKTHQSHIVGRWYREAGIEAITTSSFRMASYFAADGWEDILIAFPFNVRLKKQIHQLSQKIELGITVEDEIHLEVLSQDAPKPISVYIKVDCGTGRTGIPASDKVALAKLANKAAQLDGVHLKGILAHAGHTYKARSKSEIESIHHESMAQLGEALDIVRQVNPTALLSYGDTPSCSTQQDFGPAQELRAGNFVFYDLTQEAIGSCSKENIAVALAAPVVARHPDRQEIIVHGGATHLAKDHLVDKHGQTIFGRIYPLTEKGWDLKEELGYMRKVSQEHGIVKLTNKAWTQVKIGDLVAVLPVHSCHAAHAMGAYLSLEGAYIDMLGRSGKR